MKQTLLIGLFFLTVQTVFGQHLYPEKYDDCKLSRFCLDCGDPKAELPDNAVETILSGLNQKSLKKINGTIKVQILVDTLGNPCLISSENNTNVSSKKLDLQNAIYSMPKWAASMKDEKAQSASVSLELVFQDGKFGLRRLEFDFSKNTNFKSVGTPDVKGSKAKDLSVEWEIYNQSNSDVPWDMSRSIATDSKNNVWVSTDNGLVKISGTDMTVFNSDNSPIQAKRGKTFTTYLTIDANDNVWFTDGYNGYRFDHNEWTVFDTLNYPLRWTIGIEPDTKGNVYFRTFQGIRKYDGESWSIIDKSNTDLPMERISGIYVDSKNRTWIGTYEGNIRIDEETTVKFENPENPLSQASISKISEDSKGNLWFDLYNKDKSKAGIWLLKPNGEWTSIRPKNSELFTKNDVNDFLLDEENDVLWIALNSVGLIRYDIQNDKWETYTPENSNVPSIHVMKLTKDKDGTIWAATFAGVMKMKK
jgi:ligand-binding sensor domain-containing protein